MRGRATLVVLVLLMLERIREGGRATGMVGDSFDMAVDTRA